MRTLASFVLIAFSTSLIGASPQETLAEQVRGQRVPLEVQVRREFPPSVPLDELARAADLVARVVVLQENGVQVSSNGTSAFTEYLVQIQQEFKSSRMPTPTNTVVVRKPGGALTIEGYPVKVVEPDFPPFRAGEEHILFLQHDLSTDRYVLPYGAQGAFRIINGEAIEQVSTKFGTWNQEHGRKPVSEFLTDLAVALPPQ